MFLAVWTGSMAAMMLPGTVPLLRLDYAVTRSRARTALVVAGYLAVWAALGLAALPLDGVFMGRGRGSSSPRSARLPRTSSRR